MDSTLFFITVMIHRIGFIIVFICSGVIIALPNVFRYESDQEFAQNAYRGLLLFCRIGLILLAITGPIRLINHVPDLIFIKVGIAIITGFTYFIVNVDYKAPLYFRINFIRIFLVVITAGVGLII